MSRTRARLVREAAARGKYAPLYTHLSVRAGREWRATFAEIERILGFRLPPSARLHRPWWSNPGRGGGPQPRALAWSAAGWRTGSVDLEAETLVFSRIGRPTNRDRDPSSEQPPRRRFTVDDIFTPHDPGPTRMPRGVPTRGG